jgi:hypothetical protein
VVELFLVSSDGSPVEDASWFYRMIPLEGPIKRGRVPMGGDGGVMRAGTFDVGPHEAGDYADAKPGRVKIFRLGDNGKEPLGELRLVLASGRNSLVDVIATGLVRGKRCYAQTSSLLYGQSPDMPFPASNATDPRWPSFGFKGTGGMYLPKAGDRFTLLPREGSWEGPLQAWRDAGPVPGRYGTDGNGYSFTPDDDPELTSEAGFVSKPVFMLARTPDGGTLSYTFYLHRSRYAGQDHPLGIALCAAAFLLTGLSFLAVRVLRRVPQHALEAI